MYKFNERLNILKEHNPFISSSVGDPWLNLYPDVHSVNEHAFGGISHLVRQKIESPALNCAALILGEVGSGKTHILGRMLRLSKDSDFLFSFAYVQPIEDATRPFTYLLRELIINLSRPLSLKNNTDFDTQIHRLIAKILEEAYENKAGKGLSPQKGHLIEIKKASVFQRLKHRFTDFSKGREKKEKNIIYDPKNEAHQKAVNILRRSYPELSKKFLAVLFDYSIPEKQPAATEWLKGNVLDEEDAEMLGVADRSELSFHAREHEARDILNALGILMARYEMPVLICFDRLENLETNEQIQALGKMIEFMVDKGQALLPLVCVRGQQWEEKFRYKLNQHVVSRLENNMFELEACTLTQSLEIIQSRLTSVPGMGIIDLFPFNINDLEETFKGHLYSPRAVINIANEKLRSIFRQPPSKTLLPMEKLKDEFEKQRRLVLDEIDSYPPDHGRLSRALEFFMNYRPENNAFGVLNMEDRQKDSSDLIDFIATIKYNDDLSHPALFIIDLERHHIAVKARIQKGITSLIEHSPIKVIYIRDARCSFPEPPRWKETNQKFRRFKNLGGQAVFLGSKKVAGWYALALLSYAVKEGDIAIPDEKRQMRPILWEDFENFVRQNFGGEDCPFFGDLEEALSEPPSEKPSVITSFMAS